MDSCLLSGHQYLKDLFEVRAPLIHVCYLSLVTASGAIPNHEINPSLEVAPVPLGCCLRQSAPVAQAQSQPDNTTLHHLQL